MILSNKSIYVALDTVGDGLGESDTSQDGTWETQLYSVSSEVFQAAQRCS